MDHTVFTSFRILAIVSIVLRLTTRKHIFIYRKLLNEAVVKQEGLIAHYEEVFNFDFELDQREENVRF